MKAGADVPVVAITVPEGYVGVVAGTEVSLAAGRAGSSGSLSQASKSSSSSAPVRWAAKARKSPGRHRAATVLGDPVLEQREERVVADGQPQRVQRQRSALVDAVVEHQLRARVHEHQVLVEVGQLLLVVPRPPVGAVAARRLRPQPLAIAGEPLVQPDVLPPRQGHVVAEPLVRQLVGNQPDRAPVVATEVPAERRQALRLERDLELVGRDHRGVRREGVGPEPVDEGRHHLGLAAERRLETGAGIGRDRGGHGDRGARIGPQLVAPDLDRGQIGRHRLDLLVAPGDGRRAAALLGELAVRDHRVVGGGRHRDRVRRLVVGPVVAGEPGRRAVRLPGDDHAVVELLPAGVPVVLVRPVAWARRRT